MPSMAAKAPKPKYTVAGMSIEDALAHLGALDLVYTGLIAAHRKAIEATEEPDPVTQDLLIEQSGQLEQFHWFVRAHLENAGGRLVTSGSDTERGAADKARP